MNSPVKETTHELLYLQKHAPIQLHSAAISLNILFSIFPLMLVVVSFFAFAGANPHRAQIIQNYLVRLLPPDVLSVFSQISENLFNSETVGIFSIAFFLLVFGASRTVRSVIRSLDSIYRNEKTSRKLLNHFLIAFVYTTLVGLLVFVASTLLIWGELLFNWLSFHLPPNPIFQILVSNLQLPLFFLISFFGITLIYRFVPSHEHTSLKAHIPGALLATIAWIIGSFLFKLYLSIAGNSELYGAIGAMIVLIMYIQLSVYAFLAGAYMNSIMEQTGHHHSWVGRAWESIRESLRS